MRLPIAPILLFLISLTACQSEQDRLQQQIAELESAVEAEPVPEQASALLQQYQNYISQYPDDASTNARYLYRAAALQYRMNRFSGAVNLLQQAIGDYYNDANTPQSAFFLGDIYQEKLRNGENATTVFQALIKAFPESQPALDASQQLSAELPPVESRLEQLEAAIFPDTLTGQLDYRAANNFIASAEIYALLLPNDEKTPSLLFRAGEAAHTIRSFNKALTLYEQVSENYPDSERASMALFMRAFTLDSGLKRIEEARKLYEEFIARYPESDFADDAQASLENLGKDDEEIIRSFQYKNEQAEKAGLGVEEQQ